MSVKLTDYTSVTTLNHCIYGDSIFLPFRMMAFTALFSRLISCSWRLRFCLRQSPCSTGPCSPCCPLPYLAPLALQFAHLCCRYSPPLLLEVSFWLALWSTLPRYSQQGETEASNGLHFPSFQEVIPKSLGCITFLNFDFDFIQLSVGSVLSNWQSAFFTFNSNPQTWRCSVN